MCYIGNVIFEKFQLSQPIKRDPYHPDTLNPANTGPITDAAVLPFITPDTLTLSDPLTQGYWLSQSNSLSAHVIVLFSSTGGTEPLWPMAGRKRLQPVPVTITSVVILR